MTTTIKVRAHKILPGDFVFIGALSWLKYRVAKVEYHKMLKPRKVTVTMYGAGGLMFFYVFGWDSRCVVERSDGPSDASKSLVDPSPTLKVSPALPEPSDRVAALIAEAREEFIAKVRKIIRDNP